MFPCLCGISVTDHSACSPVRQTECHSTHLFFWDSSDEVGELPPNAPHELVDCWARHTVNAKLLLRNKTEINRLIFGWMDGGADDA